MYLIANRLQQLRGDEPIGATAMLASVGDASQFKNGRQMAASLEVVPLDWTIFPIS
jgi:transposase